MNGGIPLYKEGFPRFFWGTAGHIIDTDINGNSKKGGPWLPCESEVRNWFLF